MGWQFGSQGGDNEIIQECGPHHHAWYGGLPDSVRAAGAPASGLPRRPRRASRLRLNQDLLPRWSMSSSNCPVLARKRTPVAACGMFGMCRKQTPAPNADALISHSGSPALLNPSSHLAKSADRRKVSRSLRFDRRNSGSIWRKRAMALAASAVRPASALLAAVILHPRRKLGWSRMAVSAQVDASAYRPAKK
jgi:hypothetical protein